MIDRTSMEDLMKHELRDGDTFAFECRMCGKCCRGRDDDPIVLTGADVFRAARLLKISTAEFINRYCRIHLGPQSHCPVVTLRAKSHMGACPLLKDGKCSIQSDKPAVCAIFPLGRWYDPKEEKWHYFTQGETCEGCRASKRWTAKEWTGNFNMEEANRYAAAFDRLVSEIAPFMRNTPLEKISSERADIMAALLYAGFRYDEGAPSYEEQIEERIGRFREIAKILG